MGIPRISFWVFPIFRRIGNDKEKIMKRK